MNDLEIEILIVVGDDVGLSCRIAAKRSAFRGQTFEA
jgi:hypothetical protein